MFHSPDVPAKQEKEVLMAQQQNQKSQAFYHQLQGAVTAFVVGGVLCVMPMMGMVGYSAYKSQQFEISLIQGRMERLETDNENLRKQVSYTKQLIAHEKVVGSTQAVAPGLRQSAMSVQQDKSCLTLLRQYRADGKTGLYDDANYVSTSFATKGRCEA